MAVHVNKVSPHGAVHYKANICVFKATGLEVSTVGGKMGTESNTVGGKMGDKSLTQSV